MLTTNKEGVKEGVKEVQSSEHFDDDEEKKNICGFTYNDILHSHVGMYLLTITRRLWSLSPLGFGLWNTITAINSNAESIAQNMPRSNYNYGSAVLFWSYNSTLNFDRIGDSNYNSYAYLNPTASHAAINLKCNVGPPQYIKMGCTYNYSTIYWGFVYAWMIYWGTLALYHFVYSFRLSPFDLRYYLALQVACSTTANKVYIYCGMILTLITAATGWYYVASNYAADLPGQSSVANSVLQFLVINVIALFAFSKPLFKSVSLNKEVWVIKDKQNIIVDYSLTEPTPEYMQKMGWKDATTMAMPIGLIAYYQMYYTAGFNHELRRVDIRMIPQERTIYNLYGGILSVDDVFKEISEKLMRMEMIEQFMLARLNDRDKQILREGGGDFKPVDLFWYKFHSASSGKDSNWSAFSSCHVLMQTLYCSELTNEQLDKMQKRQFAVIEDRANLLLQREVDEQKIIQDIETLGAERKKLVDAPTRARELEAQASRGWYEDKELETLKGWIANGRARRDELDAEEKAIRDRLHSLTPKLPLARINQLLLDGGMSLAGKSTSPTLFESIMRTLFPYSFSVSDLEVGTMFTDCQAPQVSSFSLGSINAFFFGAAAEEVAVAVPEPGCCEKLSLSCSDVCSAVSTFCVDTWNATSIIGMDGLNMVGQASKSSVGPEPLIDIFHLLFELLKFVLCINLCIGDCKGCKKE